LLLRELFYGFGVVAGGVGGGGGVSLPPAVRDKSFGMMSGVFMTSGAFFLATVCQKLKPQNLPGLMLLIFFLGQRTTSTQSQMEFA